MKRKEHKTEIAIIGGGVTGLMLLKKLSELGYESTLIEKESTVGNGPSAKNEGILHMGTRHAVATKDLEKANKIVDRCQYGGNQILQYAPESISDPDLRTFAVLTSEDDVDEIVNRWEEAGVKYEPVSLGKFSRLVPETDISRLTHVFQTADTPINVRVLYQKLLKDAQRAGGQLFLNQKFFADNDQSGTLVHANGEKRSIKADLFVVTTGQAIKEIFQQVTGEELPMRFWKSNMVVTPRLAKHGLMHVRNGEANVTHQGNTTIGGQWEDATVVYEPSLKPDPERVKPVFSALERAFPSAQQYQHNFFTITCIKPDVAQFATMARSVDIEVFEPGSSNYIFALPGKMTESPYVADELVRMVFHRNSESLISLRPSDLYNITNTSMKIGN